MNMSRVQVIPDCAFEQSRILRDDGKAAPEVQESYSRCVQGVNADVPLSRFDDPEEGKSQRTLPCSSTADYTNLLIRLNVEIDVLEHKVQAFSIPRAVIIELYTSICRPACFGSIAVDHLGSLAWQSCIFQDTFYRYDIGLDLDGLTDDPVERGSDIERIRHHQANKTGGQFTATCNRDNSESSSAENDDRS